MSSPRKFDVYLPDGSTVKDEFIKGFYPEDSILYERIFDITYVRMHGEWIRVSDFNLPDIKPELKAKCLILNLPIGD